MPVPVTKVLHLKSGVTALPDGTVIGFEPLVDAPQTYPRVRFVPEEHGAAVVDLGDGAVVMSADAPRTAGLLRACGLDVVTAPVTEFEKLEGCVTCLSSGSRLPARPRPDRSHDGSITTGTCAARISFAARDPRNTRASGPAADDPMASSSSRCQSMLRPTRPSPSPSRSHTGPRCR